jgi:hypothetical protein
MLMVGVGEICRKHGSCDRKATPLLFWRSHMSVEVKITAEQLSAMSDRLVSKWLMDDIPHDVRGAISAAVAEKLKASGEWQALADAIAAKFEARRDEIAQRIVTGMIETMSRGIVDACRESVTALAERMSKMRIY